MINNCVEINMTQYKNWKVVLFDLGIERNIKGGICHHKLTDNEVKVKERNCFNKYQGLNLRKMEPFYVCCSMLLPLPLSILLSLPSYQQACDCG